MNNQNVSATPEPKKEQPIEVTLRDYVFLGIFFILSLFLAHSTAYSFCAEFALVFIALLAGAVVYLKDRLQFSLISYISLIASFIISASFFIHDENYFSSFKLFFLAFSVSVFFISSCEFKNKWLNSFKVIVSPFFLVFSVGMANAPKTARSVASKKSGVGAKLARVVLALLCVIPLAAILIFLLMYADAAFEGFIDAFNFDFTELPNTLFFGIVYFFILFTTLFAVKKKLYTETESKQDVKKGIDSLFVNTILTVVAIIYLFFIITQFSYIFGGFAGLLPKAYTYSEYARRGFGEMCVICIINFLLLAVAMAKTDRDKNGEVPFVTRLLSVFISSFSIFLIIVAIAKMFMYIRNYGLTFLRLGTSIFMLFLFFVFAAMIIKVFKPKFAHISVMIAAACIIMSVFAIFDPHSIIASYNINAYESGMHESIDVFYLHYDCGAYGTEPLIKLTKDENEKVSSVAWTFIKDRAKDERSSEFRRFNLAEWYAKGKLDKFLGELIIV